jgi:hypothetical protein
MLSLLVHAYMSILVLEYLFIEFYIYSYMCKVYQCPRTDAHTGIKQCNNNIEG